MADFVSGMNQGLSTARNMIYGDQQAKDETSILSSRAQEQKLALHEHQQSYAAKMAIYSSEKDFAREKYYYSHEQNPSLKNKYPSLQHKIVGVHVELVFVLGHETIEGLFHPLLVGPHKSDYGLWIALG